MSAEDFCLGSHDIVWMGKPWIVPSVVYRTIVVAVVAAVVVWLEIFFGVVNTTSFLGVGIVFWTSLVFFIIWIGSLLHLVLLRASNTYILRNDSLEIRTGILTSRSAVITSSGFSDLEVIRSVSARMLNMGDIIIRTQSETDSNKMMVMVRNPLNVGGQIREVMAHPIVRIEGQVPPPEKKP